jgi:hypothetical protein
MYIIYLLMKVQFTAQQNIKIFYTVCTQNRNIIKMVIKINNISLMNKI